MHFGRQTANFGSDVDVQRYIWDMAMLPAKQFVRTSAVGLALAGAALAGLTAVSAGHASTSTLVGLPAIEAPPPPPPDPIPIIGKEKSDNPGSGSNEAPQPRPRRHHG
jgi:hypothetical protein